MPCYDNRPSGCKNSFECNYDQFFMLRHEWRKLSNFDIDCKYDDFDTVLSLLNNKTLIISSVYLCITYAL